MHMTEQPARRRTRRRTITPPLTSQNGLDPCPGGQGGCVQQSMQQRSRPPPADGAAADAMPWEAPRKVHRSATSPDHLLARTRLDGAALVSMLRRSARGRPGLRIRRMARGPPRHRCLGRSTSRAGVARLPGRTERHWRSGKPWRNML